MRRSASDLLSQNYGLVAKALFTPLLDVFGAARSTFDGDIERTVVLLEVAVRTLQDPRFADADLSAVLSGELGAYPALSASMRSIADSSGIPKETVRRKVTELVLAGWFARHGASLHYTAQAYRELAPVREKIRRMAVRHYEVIAALCVAEEVRTGGA